MYEIRQFLLNASTTETVQKRSAMLSERVWFHHCHLLCSQRTRLPIIKSVVTSRLGNVTYSTGNPNRPCCNAKKKLGKWFWSRNKPERENRGKGNTEGMREGDRTAKVTLRKNACQYQVDKTCTSSRGIIIKAEGCSSGHKDDRSACFTLYHSKSWKHANT